MKIYAKTLLALLLLSAAFSANAWDCTYWHQSTDPNAECYVPPVTPPTTPPPTSNKQHQGQNQHQGQQQGQGQGQIANGGAGGQGGTGIGQGGSSNQSQGITDSGNSRSTSGVSIGDMTLRNGSKSTSSSSSGGNTLTGGDNTNDTRSSADNSGGNSAVSVDTSDRSVTNVAGARINTFIPGDLPGNAMTIVPGAYITTAGDTQCGTLQTKVQVPVYQWNKRGTKKVQVGYDEDLAPVVLNGQQLDYERVPLPNGGYYLRGSAVTYVLSTYGSANSSQLGLQGGGAGGYGGLAVGSGRSYSQAGVRIVIRSCIAGSYPAPIVAKPAARRVIKQRHRVLKRKTVAQCVPRTAKTCPAA